MLPEDHEAIEDQAFREISGFAASMKVTNEGQHWRIVLRNGRSVEWWPSTGRLVVDGDWGNAQFTHTVLDVIDVARSTAGE